MKLNYRVDFIIDEAIYEDAREHLLKTTGKTSEKAIDDLIRCHLRAHGELFLIEPIFDTDE